MATKAAFYVLLRGRRGRLGVVTAQEAVHAAAHCSLVLCSEAVPGLSAEAARGAAAACEGSRFCCVDTVGALYTATGAIAHSHTRYCSALPHMVTSVRGVRSVPGSGSSWLARSAGQTHRYLVC